MNEIERPFVQIQVFGKGTLRINSITVLRHIFCILGTLIAGLSTPRAFGSMMFLGVVNGTGAGIGTSNVVLTLQNTPTEQGCVGWSGSADVIGLAACPAGLTPAISGADEKTGNSQTQTRTVTQTGVLSGSSLRAILNVSEPGGTLFTVENLSLTIYSALGGILFNSGNLVGAGVPPGGGITINSSFQGQGNLGFGFALDAVQAITANQFICTNAAVSGCGSFTAAQLSGNASNRIGVAVILTNTQGGNETISIGDAANVVVDGPEPATVLTMASALAIVVLISVRRRLPCK